MTLPPAAPSPAAVAPGSTGPAGHAGSQRVRRFAAALLSFAALACVCRAVGSVSVSGFAAAGFVRSYESRAVPALEGPGTVERVALPRPRLESAMPVPIPSANAHDDAEGLPLAWLAGSAVGLASVGALLARSRSSPQLRVETELTRPLRDMSRPRAGDAQRAQPVLMVQDYRRSARPEGSNQPDYRVDPLGNRRVPVRSLAKQFSHEMQFLDAADSEDLMHAFAEKTAEDDLRGAFAKALDDTATRDSLPPTAQFPAENMARMNPDPDGGQLSAAVLHYEVHGIQGQEARGGYPGVYQSPEASEDMRSAFAKAASERLTRDPAPSVRTTEGHVPDDVEVVSYDMLSGGTSPRFITLTPMEDEEGSIQFGGRTNGAAASQCGPMSLRQQNNEQQRQRYLGAGEEDEGRMHAHSQSGPTSGRPGSLDGSSGQHAAPAPQRPSGAYRPHVLDLRTPDPRGAFDSSRPQSIDFMGSPNARARNPVQGGGAGHWGVGAGPRDAQQTTSRYATRSPNAMGALPQGIQPMRAGSAPPDRRVRKYHGDRGARTVTAFDEPFQPIQREMPVQWNRAGQTQTRWDERDGPRGIRSSQGIELRYGPHGPNAPDGLQGPQDVGRRAFPRSWSR